MLYYTKIYTSDSDHLTIGFRTPEERGQFIEGIKINDCFDNSNYISSRIFFSELCCKPKIDDQLGWSWEDINGLKLGMEESEVDFPWYIKLPNPYPMIKKNITGIDDGGERIRYGENGAFREPADGKGRFDLVSPFALQRLARWYELGAKKYADRNWEKGIPFSRYMDSAMRHLTKYMMGMTDEDHLAAAAWNITCIMHHEELGQMELDDLPHYYQKLSEKPGFLLTKNYVAEESSDMIGKE